MRDRTGSDAIAEGKVKAKASILSRAAWYLWMWLRPLDDAGVGSDVYGNLGAPYPARGGMPKERLNRKPEPSVAVRLQQPQGEPANMTHSFLVWFCDMKARALAQGITIEELTVEEMRTWAW